MEPPSATPSRKNIRRLEVLDHFKPHTFIRPAKLIHDGPDVARFLTSQAYRDICVFVLQLNRSLCPRKKKQQPTAAVAAAAASTPPPPPPSTTIPSRRAALGSSSSTIESFHLNQNRENDLEPVKRLRQMLQRIEAMIDECPPNPGPRRFGNISFRRWHELLEARADELLREFLPGSILDEDGFASGKAAAADKEVKEEEERGAEKEAAAGPLDELKSYFLGGFGSAQRLDYGTGHELSFLAFLGCIWKLGGFVHTGGDDNAEAVERSIVLGVIEPYLKVVRRLILTYTLEPAGSHGVWGLDDHAFMPYIFGSAQLTQPISEWESMPQEGSLPGAPKPADIVKPAAVERLRDDNMYFSAIGFIKDVKTGPFWEHSPILFDVSGIKDGWGKINKGMIKMFNAEVLSKFPVVQHFRFGSLFSWDLDPAAEVPATSVHMANQPSTTATPPLPGNSIGGSGGGTQALWVQTTRMPGAGAGAALAASSGIPYSRVPPRGAVAPTPRGGAPDTGPPPPSSFPRGVPGQANNQFAVTKAPWAKG
ncbi:Phosphotyrosyl phosphate activator protein-domain-containing protein [Podospora didyma]|uniref:Serine/threonine-protein phosphatase 2A activator n=1 Tax=Podospora didyma TaxID=330526 RepID=A0AAE0NHM9_9PEZI|nr:Phosphotyrosyl phosphate activator protein-domain-containing protein [Podospora didyma]